MRRPRAAPRGAAAAAALLTQLLLLLLPTPACSACDAALSAEQCASCRDVEGGLFTKNFERFMQQWGPLWPGSAINWSGGCANLVAGIGGASQCTTTTLQDLLDVDLGPVKTVADVCGVSCGFCDATDYNRNRLRVGLPASDVAPWWQYHANQTGNARFSGMVPQVWTVAQELLRPQQFPWVDAVTAPMLPQDRPLADVEFEFVPLQLSGALSDSELYLLFGDCDATAEFIDAHALVDEVTMEGAYRIRGTRAVLKPVYPARYSAMIQKSVGGSDLDTVSWRLFLPFNSEVWGVLLSGVVALGILLWMTEGVGFRNAQYLSWSSLLGGEDGWPDGSVQTWNGKVVRMGLLFMIFIAQNTYVANLASILVSNAKVTLRGPQNMEDLKDPTKAWKVCTTQGGDTWRRWVPTSHEANAGRSSVRTGYTVVDVVEKQTPQECVKLLQQGKDGGVAAWVDLDTLLNQYLHSVAGRCNEFAVVNGISFGDATPGFLAREGDEWSKWVMNLGVMLVSDSGALDNMAKTYFYVGKSCPLPVSPSGKSMTLHELSGLFVIVGCVIGLSLLFFFVELVRTRVRTGKWGLHVSIPGCRSCSHDDAWSPTAGTAKAGEEEEEDQLGLLREISRKLDALAQQPGQEQAGRADGADSAAPGAAGAMTCETTPPPTPPPDRGLGGGGEPYDHQHQDAQPNAGPAGGYPPLHPTPAEYQHSPSAGRRLSAEHEGSPAADRPKYNS